MCNEIGCAHTARLPIGPLIARFGPDFPVPDLGPLLRCSRCGQRRYNEARPDWSTQEAAPVIFGGLPIPSVGTI